MLLYYVFPVTEWAWHQDRTSRGSSSKESSRGLKWFVDLTGTGATKMVSGERCEWTNIPGTVHNTNLALPTQQAPCALQHGAVPLQSVSPLTICNNTLTSHLINPWNVFVITDVSACTYVALCSLLHRCSCVYRDLGQHLLFLLFFLQSHVAEYTEI